MEEEEEWTLCKFHMGLAKRMVFIEKAQALYRVLSGNRAVDLFSKSRIAISFRSSGQSSLKAHLPTHSSIAAAPAHFTRF